MINHLFDTSDLNPYFLVAATIGIFFSAWCAQLFGRNVFQVSPLAGHMRRLSVLLFGLACCWSLGYWMAHPLWQPWPPDLLVIISVDLYLSSIIISAHDKQRIMG